MDFHKLIGQIIVVGSLWQFALAAPMDQTGDAQLEREDAPGRQFGGFLVEHPDFPGRPVFLQDPPEAGTIGQRPTSLLSDFGLDDSNFPSFAAKPSSADLADADTDVDTDADADADAEVDTDAKVDADDDVDTESDTDEETEAEASSTTKPVRRRDDDKKRNAYQQQYRPQYRPQNRPQSRPQNRPHRPQNRPQRPQYEKPQPQYEKHPPQYEKPQPQPQYVVPGYLETYGKQEYEAFMVKFPGYGQYIVLAEPGSVGGQSSPFQLVHKPMGYVTLYPKISKGVQVKGGDVETPATSTAAPQEKDVVKDQSPVNAQYAGVSEKYESTKKPGT